MNNQILLGLVTIGLVASVVGVGTYAYFSDTETSTGNTMTAGKLDLMASLDGGESWMNGDGVGPLVVVKDLKPSWNTGYSDEITLKVEDNPARLYKKITNLVCNQGVSSEPEVDEEEHMDDSCYGAGGVCNLDDYTWFDMTINGEPCIPMWENGTSPWTVSQLEGRWIYLGTVDLLNGQYGPRNLSVVQSFHLDAHVTNWAQGDQCTFDEEFWALQLNDETTPEDPVTCWRGD